MHVSEHLRKRASEQEASRIKQAGNRQASNETSKESCKYANKQVEANEQVAGRQVRSHQFKAASDQSSKEANKQGEAEKQFSKQTSKLTRK